MKQKKKDMNNKIEILVKKIEAATGLTFTRSFSGSNSYYCNERRIRISDHFSKYTERMRNTFDDNAAIDLVNCDLDFALKLINKSEWFSRLKKGIKIEHSNSTIGEIEFIDANEEKEYVEVKRLSDGAIIKYDFSRINIAS